MERTRLFSTVLLWVLTILTQHTVVAEHWAVIVAGSKGYENYRHQADACHAYHVVRRHGIPAENVILMMYDDIATANENKFPGQIFNRPSDNATNALEVYEGCQIDYRGEQVTPETFMNVLLGNIHATNGKKVLNSTANDRVFINFVDHGARGFVLFPGGQMLTSSQLTKTLYSMYHQHKYKELVFYVEACHSGSMFYSWSMSHINAFVTTAANGWESSWGTYCPPHDLVNGVVMDTCLGDLYSVNWMEDSDRTDLSKETIQQQFKRTKAKTSKSHVEKFGSTRIRHEIVGNFQSNYDQAAADDDGQDQGNAQPSTELDSVSASAVDAHDIFAVLAFYKYLRAPVGQGRAELADKLIQVIQAREQADRVFESIHTEYMRTYQKSLRRSDSIVATTDTLDYCETHVFEVFKKHCPLPEDPDVQHGFNSYSLQYSGILFDLCRAIGNFESVEGLLTRSCSGMTPGQPYDMKVTSLA